MISLPLFQPLKFYFKVTLLAEKYLKTFCLACLPEEMASFWRARRPRLLSLPGGSQILTQCWPREIPPYTSSSAASVRTLPGLFVSCSMDGRLCTSPPTTGFWTWSATCVWWAPTWRRWPRWVALWQEKMTANVSGLKGTRGKVLLGNCTAKQTGCY